MVFGAHKIFNCLKVFGGDSFSIASVFLIRGFVPSLLMLKPNHSTCLHANLHLSNDIAIFSSSSFVRTDSNFCRCSSSDPCFYQYIVKICIGVGTIRNVSIDCLLKFSWQIREAKLVFENSVSLDLSDFTTCAILSNIKSMLGIFYLFLWMNLLIFLQSNAS